MMIMVLEQTGNTSETNASRVDYKKLRPLFPDYADNHHAAEMFLYIMDLKT